jgi:hypothetical protein
MIKEKAQALLAAVGSKYKGQRTGWLLSTCPFVWRHDGKMSGAFGLSVHPKKRSRVHCYSCGYSGDLDDLLLDINFELKKHPQYSSRFQLATASALVRDEFADMELLVQDIPDFEAAPPKNEVLFPEQWLASFQRVDKFHKAMAYCVEKRGLDPYVLKALDVRYDPVQERVCFPFRNFKGELMGLQGRYIGNLPTKEDDEEHGILRYYQYGYKAHRNTHIWMGEHTVNLDLVVVPCEGPIDFAKIFAVYPNVVASFTSGISMTKAKRIGDADSLVTFYDHGVGGDWARHYLEKYLPNMPMLHLIPDEDEGDAGAMTIEAIRDSLKDHVELPKGTNT